MHANIGTYLIVLTGYRSHIRRLFLLTYRIPIPRLENLEPKTKYRFFAEDKTSKTIVSLFDEIKVGARTFTNIEADVM